MLKAGALGCALFCLSGCIVNDVHSGPMEHLSRSMEMGKYEAARLELKMGAGELDLNGGSSKLVDADFGYNIPSWKPVFSAHDTGGLRADVRIEQPEGVGALGNIEYRWNVALNDHIPWDVITHLGAGEARINLGDTALRKITVHMGVGSLTLDLRGHPKHSFDVEVHGGVGEARIYLPRDASIVATAHGGIGEIRVDGLERHGNRWSNSGENAPAAIRLDANGGIGSIKISAE